MTFEIGNLLKNIWKLRKYIWKKSSKYENYEKMKITKKSENYEKNWKLWKHGRTTGKLKLKTKITKKENTKKLSVKIQTT